ncbi:MAG TPA: histidine phosphatase family protein [Solirubrobacteraceae bacterium]|nr:histidine phosphatase family protein [Solirubrobacteraceae bacterium]
MSTTGTRDAFAGILLARHGETKDNLPPMRFQGFHDTPLNDTGRAQARELAEKIAAEPEPIRSLWSSDLSRAHETAEIVGARIGLEVRLDARLREANRGRWEGYTFDEIKQSEPEAYAAWMRGGADWRFPGGESLQEQQDRVLACLRDVEATGPLPSLVVCHGGSIRVVLCSRDPRGLAAFHEFDVPNVAVLRL